MEIRPIQERHIPLLLQLWEDAGLRPKPKGRDRPEHIACEMMENPEQWIGAWEGERLIGMVLVTDDGRKGWLNRLCVHPQFQAKGIGRTLLKEGEKLLRARGRMIIAVQIDDDNLNSMEAFVHMGYTRNDNIIYFVKRDGPDV